MARESSSPHVKLAPHMPPPPLCPPTEAPSSSSALSASSSSAAFLQRLMQDAHGAAAVWLGLPPVPKRRPKTSSERGRAFRERQQRKEEELNRAVVELRREIARLDMQHKAWQTRCLSRRSSPTGSLVQLTHEYHELFAHGLMFDSPSVCLRVDERRHRFILLQEAFLRRSIDETAIVGNEVGPEASIVQWRRYTQSHDRFTLDVLGIDVTESHGDDEDEDEGVVTVTARCVVRGRLSLDSFKMLFPHVVHDRDLIERLVGIDVTYPASRSFQFTRDGRITVETVDVDFVAGLNGAGIPLTDVATLLQGSALTRDSMIVTPPASEKRSQLETHYVSARRGRATSFPYSDTLAA